VAGCCLLDVELSVSTKGGKFLREANDWDRQVSLNYTRGIFCFINIICVGIVKEIKTS
jgi:hypothetical protein